MAESPLRGAKRRNFFAAWHLATEEIVAKKDVCEFLSGLGLHAEQCELICDLLRNKDRSFFVEQGLASFDLHVIIGERVRALYEIKRKKK